MWTPANNLLGSVPGKELAALEPHLKLVQTERSAVLQKSGEEVRFAYFPCGSAVVSLEVLLNDGTVVGTMLVGREGAIGGILSHGYLPAYAQARVLLPGQFLKLALSELEKVKAESPALRRLFTGYSECFSAQLHQSAACAAAHTIEQRAATLLRYLIDRTGDYNVPLTQEDFAVVLGVTRTHVTRVLQRLRTLGVIETYRGGLVLRDPQHLRFLCCDCYDAICKHFDTVLKDVYPRAGRDCIPPLRNRCRGDIESGLRGML